ncbi:hypothetical protein ACIBO5_52350 [Nonomuraea angiospora]|uniref:hypothetical protein n=1 Tax=Nonomuraea angiospora TaxID=46172 RepID=UPI00379B5175
MSEVAYQAATKVLHQHLDVMVNPAVVGEMVAAVLAAHDTVITWTEPNLHRHMWEDAPFRQMIERRMREQLLRKVVEEGCVPVALPTVAYRYFTDPPWFFRPDMRRRPVLPELVELGAPWEFIEVELSVPVRRVGPSEGPGIHASGDL